MLHTLKSCILLTTGTEQHIYLIPPSKKINLIAILSYLEIQVTFIYLFFFASAQFKPLLYNSLLTLSTLLMVFKIIAGGKFPLLTCKRLCSHGEGTDITVFIYSYSSVVREYIDKLRILYFWWNKNQTLF